MRYKIGSLQIFATPQAEPMFQFQGLPDVTFEFQGLINTILFIHCGMVRASLRGGEDFYEIVGRLYSTYHPNQNEEKHEGKLYVYVYGYPDAIRFESYVEVLEWHPDGSFDVITPDGVRHQVTPPRNTQIPFTERNNTMDALQLVAKGLFDLKNQYEDGRVGISHKVTEAQGFVKKFSLARHKTFSNADMSILDEMQTLLAQGKMVFVIAYAERGEYELYQAKW